MVFTKARLTVYPSLVFLLSLFLLFCIYRAQQIEISEGTILLGIDFSMFYSACSLTLATPAGNPYDIDAVLDGMKRLYHTNPLPYIGFFYPPIFLLLLYPLCFLPYPLAIFIWDAGMLLFYLYIIYQIAPHRNTLFIALGFPGVFFNLLWSQTGFLVAGLWGCFLLTRHSAWRNGLVLSLLTLKPYFAILPYLLSFFYKRWRVLRWAIFFLILNVGLTIFVFGKDIWLLFFAGLVKTKELALITLWDSITGIRVSLQDSLRLVGVSYEIAVLIQVLVAMGILLLNIWAAKHSTARMNAVIMTGSVLLITPYAMQYDLMLLALPLALYGWDVYVTQNLLWGETVLLIILWLLPVINRIVINFSGIQIVPFYLLVFFGFSIRRIQITRGQY